MKNYAFTLWAKTPGTIELPLKTSTVRTPGESYVFDTYAVLYTNSMQGICWNRNQRTAIAGEVMHGDIRSGITFNGKFYTLVLDGTLVR